MQIRNDIKEAIQPRNDIKEVMEALHKGKMQYKKERRDMWHETTQKPHVMANLSVNHENYGAHPREAY